MTRAMVMILAVAFYLGSQPYAAGQARRAVIIICSGDPLTVVGAQASAGAPTVSLKSRCTEAISSVLSAPTSKPDAVWHLDTTTKQTPHEQIVVYYTIVEAVLGRSGPPGPQGPSGPAGPQGPAGSGGAVLGVDNIYLRVTDGGRTLCDPGDKILGGGASARQFNGLANSFPYTDETSPGCSPAQRCEGWTSACFYPIDNSPRSCAQVRAICLRRNTP